MITSENQQIMRVVAVIALWIQTTCQQAAIIDRQASVVITNDGPTILGATTTFNATLVFTDDTPNRNPSLSSNAQPYTYQWRQQLCGAQWEMTVSQDRTCTISLVYNCYEDLGDHEVDLVVSTNLFSVLKEKIAANSSFVVITESINAKLIIEQGGSCNVTQGQEDCDVVATNKSVGLRVQIHDPSRYFKDAWMMYEWQYGDGIIEETVDQPMVYHNYSKPGNYVISVEIKALFKIDQDSKSGEVNQNLRTLNAVQNLTIRGSSSPDVGAKVTYNISFYASLPANLSWCIAPKTLQSKEQYSSVQCNNTRLTDRSWVAVQHKFNKSGHFGITVQTKNEVSSMNSSMNINAYDSTKPQQVTGLIIGILFGIAGCFICVAVVFTYLKKQNHIHIEVANFDFLKVSFNRSDTPRARSDTLRAEEEEEEDMETTPLSRVSAVDQYS